MSIVDEWETVTPKPKYEQSNHFVNYNQYPKFSTKSWTHLYLIGSFCDKNKRPLYWMNTHHTLIAIEYRKVFDKWLGGKKQSVYKLLEFNGQVDMYINNAAFEHYYWMDKVYTSTGKLYYTIKNNGVEKAEIYRMTAQNSKFIDFEKIFKATSYQNTAEPTTDTADNNPIVREPVVSNTTTPHVQQTRQVTPKMRFSDVLRGRISPIKIEK
ncbi:MAG: hypothetical protein Faunusvirus3_35 [Faunusvirus sp.]|jgi:hypothetical protein|uniref:Uncharacterized protein n=1 Tax=Faunusvirus sp. TaxID=2487766 RepID=A0A3G4ZW93_9VIRU|nr:MAG: hypothetical protein Faunusvirus3_35 [Faunusvirus sp.]